MRLIAKYRDPDVCNRTFELAWSHAQLEYRYLDIQGDAAFRFDELASHLLYPNIRFRAPAERLRRNVLGQSRLWAYGISGDLAARRRFGCRFAGAWLWRVKYWSPTPTGGCAVLRPIWSF